MMTWRSIQTAPKDGRYILTFWAQYRGGDGPRNRFGVQVGPYIAVCNWHSYEEAQAYSGTPLDKPHQNGGYWNTLSGTNVAALDEADGPTHWMPMPDPPSETEPIRCMGCGLPIVPCRDLRLCAECEESRGR